MLDLRPFKYKSNAAVDIQIEEAAVAATQYANKMFTDFLTALADGRPDNLPPELTVKWKYCLARLKESWARQMGLVPTQVTPQRGAKPKLSPDALEKVSAKS
jgi:hypothetical protein